MLLLMYKLILINILKGVERVETMNIPVSILFPGTKVQIGQKQYVVKDVIHLNGLIRVLIETSKGIKSKSYAADDQIKILKQGV